MNRALKCQNAKCGTIFWERNGVVQKVPGPHDYGPSEIIVCPDCGYDYMVEVEVCVACASAQLMIEASFDEELCEECIYALDQRALENEVRQAERLADDFLENVASAAREQV
jgi:hypothetical protein